MTYRYAFVKWLGSASLVMAMTGCPGGDDEDTGAETNPVPTTSVGTDSTTGDEPTGTTVQVTTDMEGSTTAELDSSGGVACNPPCEAGQECVGGACVDMPGDSTTGDPPMECGLAVTIQAPNPACGPCLEENCCPELQGCFGDETTMEMTECLQLNNCVAKSCMGVAPMDIQACIDKNCADFSGAFNLWAAYQTCAGMNCMAECM